jgi:predicted ATPase/DNA-binding XRE family transcriptional regulator/Tfp pilus assembly protein PilF
MDGWRVMVDDEQPTFRDLLRRARRAAGLTQEELAEKAGLSTRAVSNLERGINQAPQRETFEMLVNALDVTPEERREWENARQRGRRQARELATRSAPGHTQVSTNLPAPLASFVGRRESIERLTDLLRRPEIRWLTLTGPGGVGKTRLAQVVGQQLRGEYPDGVWFVSLAELRAPEQVLPAIAAVLGVPASGDRSVADAVRFALRDKRLLLVLDNMEHLTTAALPVSNLLGDCSGLTILATSRVPLHVPGEQEYPVPALDLPGESDRLTLEELGTTEAVALFVSRAQAVRPDFQLTNQNAPAVVAICRRLDGLPLAIELAAARIRLLPPEAMLPFLDERLALLHTDALGVPERHRTLRSTIAWSYDLLNSRDQRLFRALSVFRGGWTLDAALDLIAGDGDFSGPIDVLDGLERLAEHGFVRPREETDGSSRFSMLETIREFGAEQLATSGELDRTRRRHFAYFATLAGEAASELRRVDTVRWVIRLAADEPNLLAAVSWVVDHGTAEEAVGFVRSLADYWKLRGNLSEARAAFDAALAVSGGCDSVERAQALAGASWVACYQGDYPAARRFADGSRAMSERLGDRSTSVWALHCLGRVSQHEGRTDEARRHYEASIALSRHISPDGRGMSSALGNLGHLEMTQGNLARARALMEEAILVDEAEGEIGHLVQAVADLGTILLRSGQDDEAERKLFEALELQRSIQDQRSTAYIFEDLATLALRRGDVARSVRLFAAAAALREQIGATVPADTREALDSQVTEARQALDHDAFDDAWDWGQSVSLDDAIAYALDAET